MSIFFSVLAAVVLLGILITLHELGHYLAGRRLGLPVVEFAVGFGPKLLGWEKNGIAYSLRALPLGGYCAFEGEDTGEEGTGRSLMDCAPWRRLVMQLSGPAMNLLTGYLLAVILLSVVGLPYSTTTVLSVEENRPAAQAGMLPGDTIVAINGMEVSTAGEISGFIRGTQEPVRLTLQSEGGLRDLTITPFFDEQSDAWRVGFSFMQDYQTIPIGQSITSAAQACVGAVGEMLGYLRDILFGKQSAGDVVGVVGAVSMISHETREGFAAGFRTGVFNVINLAILISVNLGLMNLLPLPALDGGRIVFSLIEIIARRPVPRKAEAFIHTAGMVLLFGLMGLLVFKDVIALIAGRIQV